MGKELQEHGRHGRGPGFAVGSVPELSSGPVGLEVSPDVFDDLCLDEICQFTAVVAALAAGKAVAALAKEGIDGQSADNPVVRSRSSIGMEGQREVEGNPFPFRPGIRPGPAAQIRNPLSASGIILRIIRFPLIEKVHVHPAPLHAVHRPLRKAGESGGGPFRRVRRIEAPCNLPDAAAEPDRISGNNAASYEFMTPCRPVVQPDIAAGAHLEGSEIHPDPAADFLVDAEMALPAEMMDRIGGGIRAFRYALVGDIDSQFPGRIEIRIPVDGRGSSVPGRHFDLPGGAHRERIVIPGIDGLRIRKTNSGVFPVSFFDIPSCLADPFSRSGKGRIIVADDLLGGSISFPRGHDIGPGIFQHGNEKG